MKKYSVAVYDIHGGASLLTHKDKTEFTLATAKKYAAEFGYKFYGSVKVFDAAESIPPAPVKKNPAPSLGRYQGRHTVSSDGSVYALIVRVDRDGQESVIHGYKGRHFASLKAAEKSTGAYIDKMDITEIKTNPVKSFDEVFTVTKKGMDANGNYSVWVSMGGSRARKIQTNGNLPLMHRERAITEETLREIGDYIMNEYSGNPLPRTRAKRPGYIGKKSQITGRAPSPRLKKRRAKNTEQGYFPNPVDVNTASYIRSEFAVLRPVDEYGVKIKLSTTRGATKTLSANAHQLDAIEKVLTGVKNTRKQNPVTTAKTFDGFVATYTVSAELNRDYWVVLGKFADKKIAVDFAKLCAKKYPECAVEVTDNK